MTLIDGLRGIAALSVVGVHAEGLIFAGSHAQGDFFDWLSKKIYILCHGVDIFFVISGFVIAFSIGRVFVTPVYAARFALRRSLRLDPPYWCAIVLAIIFTAVRNHSGNQHVPWPTSGALVAHLFYLQAILKKGQINPVFWTLCIEVQFYIVFIALLTISHSLASFFGRDHLKLAARLMLVAYMVSLAWACGCLPNCGWGEKASVWFGSNWHKFLLGAVIYYSGAGFLPKVVPIFALAALLVAILSNSRGPFEVGVLYQQGLWVGLATATLVYIAGINGGLYSWLNWKPLQYMGLVSYSLYLVHIPIIHFLLGIQTRTAGRSMSGAILFVLAAYVISLVLAYAMYRLVEKPSMRVAKGVKERNADSAPDKIENKDGHVEAVPVYVTPEAIAATVQP